MNGINETGIMKTKDGAAPYPAIGAIVVKTLRATSLQAPAIPSPITRYLLPVTRYLLLVTRYSLLVTCYLLLLLLFTSCNPQTKPKRDYAKIIPQDSLILIIKDIYTIDATLTTAINTQKIKPDECAQYYKYTLNKHKISKERFDASIKYYSESRTALVTIYNEVLDQLILAQTTTEHK